MPRFRSVLTRPWRRLRRWRNRTPNDQLAFSLLGFGCLLVLVAALRAQRRSRLAVIDTDRAGISDALGHPAVPADISDARHPSTGATGVLR